MHEGSRAVIYTRISQDRTGEERAVTRQEEDCRRKTDYMRWQVVAVETDSISASSGKKRPGWERVLERVRAGDVDVIVAYHFDRITRTMVDLEELILMAEETGVGVSTVTGDIDLTTDVGRMVSRILAAVARQEVERKAARQKFANTQRAKAGKMWQSGWRAFGYDRDDSIVEDEAEAIRSAVADFLAGNAEIKDIAKRWTEAGLQPTSGRKGAWNLPTVRNILKNPKYAGLRDYDGTEYVGTWEPIITLEQHYEARAKLEDPARRSGGNPGGRHPINLLTSIAFCRNSHPVRSAVVNDRPVYQCRNGCVTLTKASADNAVLEAVAACVRVLPPGSVLPALTRSDAGTLELKREGLRSRLADADASYVRGTLTLERFESLSKVLEADLAEVEAQLGAVSVASMGEIQRNALNHFERMTLKQRRDMLTSLQTEIVMLSPGRGKRNVDVHKLMLMSIRTMQDSAGGAGPDSGLSASFVLDSGELRWDEGEMQPRRIAALRGGYSDAAEALAHIDRVLGESQ